MTSTETLSVRPFEIAVPQAGLDDLQHRLEITRLPEPAPGDDWSYGTPVGYLRETVEHWRTAFDWRAQEKRMNAVPNFRTEVDGQTVHFVHVRSAVEDATPIVLTHTYPGSFVDFLDLVGPLTDPVAHGGRAEDAFHVVIPSIPGFGFSTPLADGDWTAARVARTWDTLMRGLGYDSYAAHGSDMGANISQRARDHEPARVPRCPRAPAVLVPVR
jgi:pimeloyl-ACP methyl ester carboxylesterase